MEFTELGTVGILLTIVTAMGRYILKVTGDCASERKECWAAVTELTVTVNEMAKELAIHNAGDRK